MYYKYSCWILKYRRKTKFTNSNFLNLIKLYLTDRQTKPHKRIHKHHKNIQMHITEQIKFRHRIILLTDMWFVYFHEMEFYEFLQETKLGPCQCKYPKICLTLCLRNTIRMVLGLNPYYDHPKMRLKTMSCLLWFNVG